MRFADLDPDTAHLRETLVEPAQAWRGGFLDVRRDLIALPDGSETRREYIVHPGAVMIVPILDDERLVVERQWRYPIGQAMLEFPAGKLERGEPVLSWRRPRAGGRRPAIAPTNGARAGILHNAIAYSTEGIEIWFARGLQAGPRRLDAGEFLDVAEASLEELDAAAPRRHAHRCEDADRPALVAKLARRPLGRSRGPPAEASP